MFCTCLLILVNLGWIPHGHGVWSFLYVVGFSRLKFCWEFLRFDGSKILAYNFLFGNVIVLFCYEGEGGFIECPWECSLFLHPLEKVKKDGSKFLFVCLVQFAPEAIMSWTSACSECYSYIFDFIFDDNSVQHIYFSLIGRIHVSQMSISSGLSNLLAF